MSGYTVLIKKAQMKLDVKLILIICLIGNRKVGKSHRVKMIL